MNGISLLGIGDSSFGDSSGWGTRRRQKSKRIRRKSRIYFIQEGPSGPVKIGVTSNPEKRLVNLQVANPHPLRLLGTVPGTKEDEDRIHIRFASLKIQGEWFLSTPELMSYITEMLGSALK